MCLREKQLVIIYLKSMHLAHGKMDRGHEKWGWLNPRIKRSNKADVKYLDLLIECLEIMWFKGRVSKPPWGDSSPPLYAESFALSSSLINVIQLLPWVFACSRIPFFACTDKNTDSCLIFWGLVWKSWIPTQVSTDTHSQLCHSLLIT